MSTDVQPTGQRQATGQLTEGEDNASVVRTCPRCHNHFATLHPEMRLCHRHRPSRRATGAHVEMLRQGQWCVCGRCFASYDLEMGDCPNCAAHGIEWTRLTATDTRPAYLRVAEDGKHFLCMRCGREFAPEDAKNHYTPSRRGARVGLVGVYEPDAGVESILHDCFALARRGVLPASTKEQ